MGSTLKGVPLATAAITLPNYISGIQ